MQTTIIISAILASVAAAPVYLLAEAPQVYHAVPLTSKSTYTQSSQVVNHGGTFVHTPIVHTPVVPIAKTTFTKSNQVISHGASAVLHPVHSYEVMPVHELYHVPLKTTVTKSNQVVNHGGTTILHSSSVPVVHGSVVQTPAVYHSSPLVSLKSGDSAITHHSSTVHETVPIVKSLPLVAVHH